MRLELSKYYFFMLTLPPGLSSRTPWVLDYRCAPLHWASYAHKIHNGPSSVSLAVFYLSEFSMANLANSQFYSSFERQPSVLWISLSVVFIFNFSYFCPSLAVAVVVIIYFPLLVLGLYCSFYTFCLYIFLSVTFTQSDTFSLSTPSCCISQTLKKLSLFPLSSKYFYFIRDFSSYSGFSRKHV